MAGSRAAAKPLEPLTWARPEYPVEVSAVIVTYNGCVLLERTLQTLLDAATQRSLEVIVVDNASVDSTLDMVRTRFPQVHLVANDQNVGLTRSNNQGMRLARGKYLFLPDNDVIVKPGAVDALARHLDAHAEVGAVGSKVLNIDGSIQGTVKNLPSPAAAVFGRHSVLTRLWPANRFSRRYLIYTRQDFSRPFRAGSVARCAMMVRREAIDAAGPMDEQYFVYWSDVDWCRAIWEAGFEVHCVPESVIIHDEHQGSQTARKPRSRRAIVDFHTGAYRYYRKWHVPHPLHPAHLVALVGLSTRAVAVLATERLRWQLRSIVAGASG